jgi:hypothetical protein
MQTAVTLPPGLTPTPTPTPDTDPDTDTLPFVLIREIVDVVMELLKGRQLTMPVFQEICTNQLIQGMLKHGPVWMRLSDCLFLDPLGRLHEAMILLAQNPLPLVAELLSAKPLLLVAEFLAQNPLPPVAELLPAKQATINGVCKLVLFLLAGNQLTWKIHQALHNIPAIKQLLRDAPVRMTLNECLIEGGFRDDMIRIAHETEAVRKKAVDKATTNAAIKATMEKCKLEMKEAFDIIISQEGKAVLLKKLGNMVEIKDIRAKAPKPINLKSLIEGDGHYVLLGEGSNIAVVHERMMRA